MNKERQVSPKPLTDSLVYNIQEVLQNMYRISSTTENILLEVPQKIPISTFSATNAYNVISIIIFLKAPALKCIFFN